MRDAVLKVQRRLGAWCAVRAAVARRDDSGAISVETAIITALLGGIAVAFGVFVADRVGVWQAEIPTP